MPENKRVWVEFADGRSYGITIGTDVLSDGMLDQYVFESHAVVITETRIANLGVDGPVGKVMSNLTARGLSVDLITFNGGEARKNLKTVSALYERLYALPGLDRRSTIVAVGGGVVGDIVGFVAATYLRGLKFVQVPTTVLSMVDSSVGGKTGVDFRFGKNLIGSFLQPAAVWIDPSVLSSLPMREVRSGLAEVVKYGVIADQTVLTQCESTPVGTGAFRLESWLIQRSCEIKVKMVMQDEYEQTGLRATLNFGHTIGHAIEGATAYKRFKHGEAVAIGMVSALHIGEVLGWSPPDVTKRVTECLRRLNLPVELPQDLSDESILALTAKDKKAVSGVARYVLLRAIEDVQLTNVSHECVVAGLAKHRASIK